MKAVSVLIVLAIISQIYTLNLIGAPNFHDSKLYLVNCPEKKSKLKGICALIEDQEISNMQLKQLFIFSKCGKGERCVETSEKVFTCEPEITFRRIGESCSYDEECYSGNCDSNQCKPAKSGKCEDHRQCAAGQVCDYATQSDKENEIKSCMKGTKDDVYNNYGACLPGYAIHKTRNITDGYSYECKRIASLDDKEETESDILCKSGYRFEQKYCDSITRVASCTKANVKEFVQFTNYGSYSNYEKCYGNFMLTLGGMAYYTQYEGHDAKNALGENLIEALDDIDFDEVYKDDLKAHKLYPFSESTNKKIYLWKNAKFLYYNGLIDKIGEPVDDYDCEYDFIVKMDSSSSLKLSLLLTIAIALLGF